MCVVDMSERQMCLCNHITSIAVVAVSELISACLDPLVCSYCGTRESEAGGVEITLEIKHAHR